MDENIINLKKYRTRLLEIKVEAEQEAETSIRDIIIDLVDWLVI